jgi:hypothetical protein
MVGLCYVMPVTGDKAYTGKEEEEDNFVTYALLTHSFSCLRSGVEHIGSSYTILSVP